MEIMIHFISIALIVLGVAYRKLSIRKTLRKEQFHETEVLRRKMAGRLSGF